MSIGFWQVLLILLIVLILFGAGHLPKVMGDIAKGVKNFRTGLREGEDTSSETEQQSQTLKDETADASRVDASSLRKEDTVSRS